MAPPLSALGRGDRAVDLKASREITFVRTKAGEVVAWGLTDDVGAQQRSFRGFNAYSSLQTPASVVAAAIDQDMFCVSLVDGQVWCSQGYGGGADGDRPISLQPVPNLPVPALGLSVQANIGYAAVDNGASTRLFRWNQSYVDQQDDLFAIDAPEPLVAISPQLDDGFALGASNTVYRFAPNDPSAFLSFFDAPDSVQLVSGSGHTCALTTTGVVYCWGRNDDHQLGLTDECQEPLACLHEAHPVHLPEDLTIVAIAACDDNSAALTESGRVWVWGGPPGWMNAGNIRPCDGVAVCAAEPTELTQFDDVTAVAIGARHLCVQRKDFTVWCWGDNSRGQVGPIRLDASGASLPEPVPVLSWPPDGSTR